MQQRGSSRLAVVIAVVACVNSAEAASSRSGAAARLAARVWLKAHTVQQPDELAELKDQNPEAYALVKALLTKRSLGLLDPKHPTASFGKPPPQHDEDVAKGPEVFRNMMTPAELAGHASGGAADNEEENEEVEAVTVPAAPVHHDWLSWRPKDSAVDDESAVKSVLGAVSELKGGGHPQAVGLLGNQRSASTNEGSAASPLMADEALISDKPHDVVEESASTVLVATHPAARTRHVNSYLKDINLAGVIAPTKPAAKRQNSDLKVLADLGADHVHSTTGEHGPLDGDLVSFKFDSEVDGGDAVKVTSESTPKPLPAANSAKQASTLLSWLGVVDKSSAKVEKQTQAGKQQPEENPYLGLLK